MTRRVAKDRRRRDQRRHGVDLDAGAARMRQVNSGQCEQAVVREPFGR
jgi:hypothetical protein